MSKLQQRIIDETKLPTCKGCSSRVEDGACKACGTKGPILMMKGTPYCHTCLPKAVEAHGLVCAFCDKRVPWVTWVKVQLCNACSDTSIAECEYCPFGNPTVIVRKIQGVKACKRCYFPAVEAWKGPTAHCRCCKVLRPTAHINQALDCCVQCIELYYCGVCRKASVDKQSYSSLFPQYLHVCNACDRAARENLLELEKEHTLFLSSSRFKEATPARERKEADAKKRSNESESSCSSGSKKQRIDASQVSHGLGVCAVWV
jgi:hypothetical protein